MKSATRALRVLFLLFSAMLLASCTGTLTKVFVEPALTNMQEQTDVELVCEGTPPYLLMIDSLIAGSPEDPDLLTMGIKAYSGYIGAMQECSMKSDRITAMADKAHHYSIRLLETHFGIIANEGLEVFSKKLDTVGKDDANKLFWTAFGLAAWVQQQQGAPAAMASLGKIEKLLLKTIELDETVQSGAAHFLLGGYYGARPVMFGGNPEKSRYHFERALQISKRCMLIYQTTFAQTYARMTMDKELHDSLLHEVLDLSHDACRSNILANQIAKRKAKRLLEEEFFKE